MINVEGLSKDYGTTRAVDDLTFTVRPGLVTGFLGPNGAGKSTTMRMILGLDQPSAGRALINGTNYRELSEPLRHVGALLDAKWVHPNRSARAHLRWMAAANGIPDSRVDQVLADVGLTSVADKRAGGFSLGMSQRLGLAGAMLGDPGVLLFDEPVNGLDPEGIVWIRNYMRALARQGRTVLVSSHLLSEMAQTADHLIVIGQGRLIADMSVAQFSSLAQASVIVRSPEPDRLAQVLGQNQITAMRSSTADGRPSLTVVDAPAERVGDIAAANHIALHELTPRNGSLEEAYMRMTAGAAQYQSGAPGQGSPGQHPQGPPPRSQFPQNQYPQNQFSQNQFPQGPFQPQGPFHGQGGHQ
ncbi:ABC transporter ATP-binding protein [Gordonia jinhuaensis]|uniref:ABC transporter ATP-binding protein n=1 Tax=Gordonia jinhuaensis TaxID=1517702 RepID=A0A916TGV5_9ACTN|nr:ABC transporter ATP-binding protein [Gordonia jinhuaensis]GGB41969.1 ABC transporter ATP-binding protein [Gordonia jinhuaensis]